MIKTIRLRVIVSVSLDCFLQFSGAFGKSLVWGIVLFYLFPLFSIPALQAAAWGTALGNFLPDNLQPFTFRTLPVFLEGYLPVTDLKKNRRIWRSKFAIHFMSSVAVWLSHVYKICNNTIHCEIINVGIIMYFIIITLSRID